MDYLLDQLRQAGPVSCRKMFGEYCLYYDGTPVGLVCNNQLFLKPTAQGRALLTDVREGSPFPGARPHLQIDADAWEDAQALCLLVRTTALALPVRIPHVQKTVVAAKRGRQTNADQNGGALLDLPNLGPKSVAMLARAGVTTVKKLRAMGAVRAFVSVRRSSPQASLNLLWALDGALSNTPWQVVAKEHRTSLLLALEQCEREQA